MVVTIPLSVVGNNVRNVGPSSLHAASLLSASG